MPEAIDLAGRDKILQVHSRGKPIAQDIDLMSIARRTPGFTGADLANVLNEAALLTARADARVIDDQALDEAIERAAEAAEFELVNPRLAHPVFAQPGGSFFVEVRAARSLGATPEQIDAAMRHAGLVN